MTMKCLQFASVILLFFVNAAVRADVSAQQMTPQNIEELQQSGPDAIGGLGDWHISNGTICATFSDLDHESDLSTKGGVLIDLGFCGRADDQFVSTQDLLGGDRRATLDVYKVDVSVEDDVAVFTAYARRGTLELVTRYSLSADNPTRLMVDKTLRRTAEGDHTAGIYVSFLFNYKSMETFLFSSEQTDWSNGFQQEEFSVRGTSAMDVASRNADTIIYVGVRDAVTPIAYGWRMVSSELHEDDGDITKLPQFALADYYGTGFITFADDFTFVSDTAIGWAQLIQVPFMDLDVGDTWRIQEEILVGANNDVAAITDQFFSDQPVLSGRVTNAQAVLHLETLDGTPVSHIHPDPEGQFSVHAPAGRYKLRTLAPALAPTEQIVELAAGGTVLPVITLAEPARIILPRGEAMRLVFKGIEGTVDPNFENTLTGYSVADDETVHTREQVPSVFLAGVESDPEAVAIKPGRYRVYATRGIEYNISKTDITVTKGEQFSLQITAPQRAITSPGYIAADLHVHSGPSFDNSFPTRKRLRTFVAEHGEVMVAAEHETMFDFAPLIAEMGLAEKMVSVIGTESTGEVTSKAVPNTIGHINFFPLKIQPHEFKKGAPLNEGRRIREIIADVRSRDPEAIGQLNHARHSTELTGHHSGDVSDKIQNASYLDHMGVAGHPYDHTHAITTFPNNVLIEADPVTGIRDIDLDAMEIMNGKQSYAPTRVQALRTDWLSFLQQGIRIVGTANSDSHTKTEQVALPRNMIALEDDTVTGFSEKAFTAAIKAGDLYGTTGPLMEITLGGAGLGETHQGTSAVLRGQIKTAPWIDAKTLRVLVNGVSVSEHDISQDAHFAINLSFSADAFVIIEVLGDAGEDYKAIYPGFTPYAFSNPIYVDANKDGNWTPPGLQIQK
ncbi:MAG: hypothetical protein COB37_00980 [Kordiimonadales bacterium]|nr:MAG: hypothetical protein COB37_00980 [Kordiimonadales bacterium]